MARRQKSPAVEQASRQPAIAAYVRVSTDEQARSGLGLDAQRRRCAAMALVKEWPDPIFYADEGISGTKDASKRPGLGRLLADVRAGTYTAVVILSLDRLGRKTRIVLDLVEEFTRCGVTLVSCKESLDTATPQGQFVLTMFAALAQLERDLIAERTRAALAEHDLRDGDVGGRLPYGYERVPGSIGAVRIQREQARVVRRIFALHADGHSLRAITAQLAGPGPRGGAWQHSAVREILSRRAVYSGGPRGKSRLTWPVILRSDPDTDAMSLAPVAVVGVPAGSA